MKISKEKSKFFIALAIVLCSLTIVCYPATPEKPYPSLAEGDRLNAFWLMGMFNVIYDWAQTTNATVTAHIADTEEHGATGAVMGTTNTQTVTNKTLGSTNSIAGEAIKTGTVADERIASTLCRDSELTTHSGVTITHGVSSAIVGVSDTQTLTNKTIGTSNSIDGGAVKAGTVADARIDAAICRDSELTAHAGLTAAHGATGAVVGTTNSQTLTNKTLTSPAINDGTTNLDGGTFIAPQTTTPAQTAEGSVVWDTDHDSLTVGTGAGRVTIVSTTEYQAIKDKALDSSNSIVGEAIKSGTINTNRLDSVVITESELSSAFDQYSTSLQSYVWPVANGGTGASDAAGARTALGVAYGTIAGTVCQGNDSRLSNARTPVSHTHGNVTNAGAIGSTANLPVITGTSGVLSAGAWSSTTPAAASAEGTAGTSNNFARGDHAHPSRISSTAPASPVDGDLWTE